MPRGGSRPNTGGKRAGAGRKPEILQPLPVAPIQQTPLDFLLATMRDGDADPRIRLEAAKVAAAYLHPKCGDIGKKGEKQKAAESVATGKFKSSAPPKLVVNNK